MLGLLNHITSLWRLRYVDVVTKIHSVTVNTQDFCTVPSRRVTCLQSWAPRIPGNPGRWVTFWLKGWDVFLHLRVSISLRDRFYLGRWQEADQMPMSKAESGAWFGFFDF